MTEENMYMDNLDEFVNDENKIVTYKWLSRNLSVHVNLAKQMLYAFVQQQRNEKNKDALAVTYCLSGFEEREGQMVHKVLVVPEEKLESSKSMLKSLTSCHIYSVHKNQLKDTNSLYSSDYDALRKDINNSNKFSGVKCGAAKLLMKEEQREVVADVQTIPEKEKTVSKGSGDSKTKTTVAAMFGNTSKNKGTVSNGSNKSTKDNKDTQPSKGKKGQLASMFANQSSKPKVEKKKEEEVKPESKKHIEQSKDSKSSNRRKHEKATSDDETVHGNDKKRRRIAQKVWESSSEEEEEEETEPEEMLPEEPLLPREPTPPRSPSPEKIKIDNSPKQNQEKTKKNRRRKLVPKTSVDEDGFMVTEKVWESESGTDMSEAEEQKPSKPEVVEKTTKKKSPVAKGKQKPKQQSIMGFFTKK